MGQLLSLVEGLPAEITLVTAATTCSRGRRSLYILFKTVISSNQIGHNQRFAQTPDKKLLWSKLKPNILKIPWPRDPACPALVRLHPSPS